MDSGCTDHIINNASYFDDYVNLKTPIDVKIGDGKILKATKIGKIETDFVVNNNKMPINISNVFYVKEMDRNLISYAKVTNKNKIISVGDTSKIFNEHNVLIGIAIKEKGIYKITSFINDKESNVTLVNNEKMTLKEKFHRMLGHVNFNYLENIYLFI